MPYRLEDIAGYETRRIVAGEAVLGFLCAPARADPQWVVFPRFGCENLLPGFQGDWKAHRFDHEADALAFLGIQPAEEARAA